AYVNKSYSDSPYDSSLYYHTSNTNLGSETNFHFKNVYNSFLRIEKTNIANRNNISSTSSDQEVLESFTTINTSNYNSASGEFQSIANHRKREGNFIEAFTNKKIRQGTINGFTDSGKIDRSNTETFLDE